MALHINLIPHSSSPLLSWAQPEPVVERRRATPLSLVERLNALIRKDMADASLMLIETSAGFPDGRCWYAGGQDEPRAPAFACLRQFRQSTTDLVFSSFAGISSAAEEPNCCLAFRVEDAAEQTAYIIALMLCRPQAKASRADMDTAANLAPRLAQALWQHREQAHRLLARELEGPLARHMPWGLIALSWWGRPLAQNALAKDMLSRSDALRCERGQLIFARAATARSFFNQIRASETPIVSTAPVDMALPVVDSSGRVRFALKIIRYDERGCDPCEASLLLLLADLTGRSGVTQCVLSSAFALSAKEAELATLLGNGASLDEAAQSMDISRNTARIHLSNVLHKTGARNQVALARILARIPSTNVLAAGDASPIPN